MANQKMLESKSETNRKWSYHQGHMDLSFVINVDVKTDVSDFKALLERAVRDLDEQLKSYQN